MRNDHSTSAMIGAKRALCMNFAPRVVTPTPVSHLAQANCGLLLPARHQGVYARLRRAMEKVGMSGRLRGSELVETPPDRAEIWFSLGACCPLPAGGARKAVPLGNRSKCQRQHTRKLVPRQEQHAAIAAECPRSPAI